MYNGKSVLITGGSRGIGAAAARAFAGAGYHVAFTYLSSESAALALQAELSAMGVQALALQADAADPAAAQASVQQALLHFGQLDVLVCNAGIAPPQSLFTDVTYDQWQRLFRVNVDGAFHYCQAVLPHFIHRKSGKIITLSSMWGQVGASCEVAYSATKGAILSMTKALAKELGPSGITVNCVSPGTIETDMNGHLGADDLAALAEDTPLGRLGRPEDAAACILFLASPAGDYLTGQVISPNGGFVIT